VYEALHQHKVIVADEIFWKEYEEEDFKTTKDTLATTLYLWLVSKKKEIID
jgi:hypothetical protein